MSTGITASPRAAAWRYTGAFWVAVTLGAMGLGGCASEPRTFATPDAAVDSLVGALRVNDEKALESILGPDTSKVLTSGDSVADANRRADFLRLYDEKHRLTPVEDESVTLEVGATDWPMPIPVVKGDQGWYFDTAAGLDEMLSRRIGHNELDAIETCLAIADAQREYAAADFNGDGWREYARTFWSDPGTKDGLYWPATADAPDSPLGVLVASATSEGYTASTGGGPRPYHGYYYRILTGQGPDAPGGAMDYIVQGHMIAGFAVVAWPADYGNSGLKTFMVSYNEVVYERDLGDDTDKLARAMTVFNPGAGWKPCEVPKP